MPYLSWQKVEKKITEEIKWLRNSIEVFSITEQYAPITCKECLLRKIAILIVTGKVRAREIRKIPPLQSFWLEKIPRRLQGKKPKMRHGGEWHQNLMEKIENHFLYQNCEVDREPNLHWGRADIGVYKKGENDLLIEVGTTSLFKLWINLERMRNFIYLIIPNDEKLIEFQCLGDKQ